MSGPVLSNTYPAVEGAIASIRHDLGTIAAYLGASESLVQDVRLASSEAATNVVESVYQNRGGRVLVSVTAREDAIAVAVSDDGHRALQRREIVSRLSLLVMRECADSVSVEQSESGGLEIRLLFTLRRDSARTRDRPSGVRRQTATA